MIDGRQKFFFASRSIIQKRWLSSNRWVLISVVVGTCLCSVLPRGRIPAHCWCGGNRIPWECVVDWEHRRYARQDNITHYHHEKTQEEWGFLGYKTQDGKGERSQDHSPLNWWCVSTSRHALSSVLFPFVLLLNPRTVSPRTTFRTRALSSSMHSLSFYISILQNEWVEHLNKMERQGLATHRVWNQHQRGIPQGSARMLRGANHHAPTLWGSLALQLGHCRRLP